MKIFSNDRKSRQKITSNTNVSVTSIGKQKVEQYDVDNPRMAILAYISESGPVSINEVSEQTGIRFGKVEKIVKMFINRGLIRTMDSGEE